MNLAIPPHLYSPTSEGRYEPYDDSGMSGFQAPTSTFGEPRPKKPKVGTGTPYIPSYMDLTNGPEPCVVCGDAATGYHYRCMTCEGCKGFFRRTIQKNLKYHCKWNNNCVIDKTTRNQCQECRFRKCVTVGMATDLVLNEKQRVAKRKLIEENRERRRMDQMRMKVRQDSCPHDNVTEEDNMLIDAIVGAYEQTAVQVAKPYTVPKCDEENDKLDKTNPEMWQQMAEILTPSIVKVVEFAKQVPGFVHLNVDDQILLLKSCCMEIMCLRAACRFNPEDQTLTLQSGLTLNKQEMRGGGLGLLVEPIFEFATSLSKLKLDSTEVALLAAVLLMQSDRTGLREPEAVERLQDAILGAYKRYIAEKRPHQPVHWAKILMKVTDLRTISTRHAERVLCIKLDCPTELPPLFLEMFDEGSSGSPSKAGRSTTPSSATAINPDGPSFSGMSMPRSYPTSPISPVSPTSPSARSYPSPLPQPMSSSGLQDRSFMMSALHQDRSYMVNPSMDRRYPPSQSQGYERSYPISSTSPDRGYGSPPGRSFGSPEPDSQSNYASSGPQEPRRYHTLAPLHISGGRSYETLGSQEAQCMLYSSSQMERPFQSLGQEKEYATPREREMREFLRPQESRSFQGQKEQGFYQSGSQEYPSQQEFSVNRSSEPPQRKPSVEKMDVDSHPEPKESEQKEPKMETTEAKPQCMDVTKEQKSASAPVASSTSE